MKKLYLFTIVLCSSLFSFSQDLEIGVKLIENNTVKKVTSSKSVLFVIEDDTHYIHFYLDLARKIKRKLRKSTSAVDFNYEMSSEFKPFEFDLKRIPNKKYDKLNYDIVCFLETSNMKNFDATKERERVIIFDLDLNISESSTNKTIEIAKLHIAANNFIADHNKEAAHLISEIIIQ
ncbi:hypothetical protein ES692_01560 [Psychroserpens burtonensis]|uniref:Uncharacterized protein n=1 Tax=Psychroserpens burtonensis TaxID=49278 RepID=A0A5C7BAP2_9FLAO|nr:hypothetical protein [Psychroserpens burtonensis]TXE19972.1 hypothetical protein ES692_01560 [Psychroserpens burtonensis]